MSAWKEPCPYDGPAHDFEPLRGGQTRYIGNSLILAICRKCGALR